MEKCLCDFKVRAKSYELSLLVDGFFDPIKISNYANDYMLMISKKNLMRYNRSSDYETLSWAAFCKDDFKVWDVVCVKCYKVKIEASWMEELRMVMKYSSDAMADLRKFMLTSYMQE